MNGSPALCIVVRDDMLSAALASKKIRRLFGPQETQKLRTERYHDRETPYPAWYLFGCKSRHVEGLVASYTSQGAAVYLCPESIFCAALPVDIIDVQFATLPDDLFKKLSQRNKTIFGYLPAEYSSKTVQAAALKKRGGERFLPLQCFFGRRDTPQLPKGPRYWIVKTPTGSAGKSSNGVPYSVWTAEKLQESLPSLLKSLPESEKIICSEFIATSDPYAGFADHVVHKMPFLSTSAGGAGPYGLHCQRLIHNCNWDALQKKQVLPLGEFIGQPEIMTGYIGRIKLLPEFIRALPFCRSRVILSVDFIIPPDGFPRYLESNKLAATFADSFDPSLPPLIDFYARLPL